MNRLAVFALIAALLILVVLIRAWLRARCLKGYKRTQDELDP